MVYSCFENTQSKEIVFNAVISYLCRLTNEPAEKLQPRQTMNITSTLATLTSSSGFFTSTVTSTTTHSAFISFMYTFYSIVTPLVFILVIVMLLLYVAVFIFTH